MEQDSVSNIPVENIPHQPLASLQLPVSRGIFQSFNHLNDSFESLTQPWVAPVPISQDFGPPLPTFQGNPNFKPSRLSTNISLDQIRTQLPTQFSGKTSPFREEEISTARDSNIFSPISVEAKPSAKQKKQSQNIDWLVSRLNNDAKHRQNKLDLVRRQKVNEEISTAKRLANQRHPQRKQDPVVVQRLTGKGKAASKVVEQKVSAPRVKQGRGLRVSTKVTHHELDRLVSGLYRSHRGEAEGENVEKRQKKPAVLRSAASKDELEQLDDYLLSLKVRAAPQTPISLHDVYDHNGNRRSGPYSQSVVNTPRGFAHDMYKETSQLMTPRTVGGTYESYETGTMDKYRMR